MDLVWVVAGIRLGGSCVRRLPRAVGAQKDTGTKEMQDVAATIYEGAIAFIRRSTPRSPFLAIITAILIGVLVGAFEKSSETGIVGSA